MIRIRPYRRGSHGARILRDAIRALGSACHLVYEGTFQVKWGEIGGTAANKIRSFRAFRDKGVEHPPFTTDKTVAIGWLPNHGIMARETVTSFEGRGCHFYPKGYSGPVVDAPLYTMYIPKRKEFRVHVYEGRVICVTEKRRKNGADANDAIRSNANGWVFCFNDIVEPPTLRELAVRAVEAVGLQLGGVDIIWNEKANRCYVLEVNSAPGLTTRSAEAYARAIVEA